MLKIKLLLLTILLFNFVVLGQNEKSVWKKFGVGAEKISISFPRLPVLIEYSTGCSEINKNSYYAYEKEVVYSLEIFSKSKIKKPEDCRQTEKFTEEAFNNRVVELKKDAASDLSKNKKVQGRELTFLHSKTNDRWILNDLKNNRWLEISIDHRDDNSPDTKQFVESLNFDSKNIGTEIGEGSSITVGDEVKTEKKVETAATNGKEIAGSSYAVAIIAKARANYTDAARTMQTQGNALLRVTFQANGGIGNITVVEGVPYGLTEQAIAAAQKLVFLPAKRNGISYTVSKQVIYSFTIY